MRTKTDTLLKVVERVIRQFIKSKNKYHTNYYFDEADLRNELYSVLGEQKNNLTRNTKQSLFQYGMSHAARYVKRNRKLYQQVDSRFDFIKLLPTPTLSIPSDRLLDTKTMLHYWCISREKRLTKAIYSRVYAYLYHVEGLSIVDIATYFDCEKQSVLACISALNREVPRMALAKDDVVILVLQNPFFHGMLARVKEPTDYGAIVEVDAHSYPQRHKWELRCTNDELLYIGTLAGKMIPPIIKGENVTGSHKKPPHAADVGKYEITAQVHGEPCTRCGAMAVIRTGTCLTCQLCGDSSGGCG